MSPGRSPCRGADAGRLYEKCAVCSPEDPISSGCQHEREQREGKRERGLPNFVLNFNKRVNMSAGFLLLADKTLLSMRLSY